MENYSTTYGMRVAKLLFQTAPWYVKVMSKEAYVEKGMQPNGLESPRGERPPEHRTTALCLTGDILFRGERCFSIPIVSLIVLRVPRCQSILGDGAVAHLGNATGTPTARKEEQEVN
ncbi:hypothetical protein WMY93_012213 [Mugilogobius chulae]|uniref:Uncharacterized protein n=1 Tax=Mugilogobius chulae TaxID=88201 RepID=A0AAW0P4D4_9GOBI